MILARRMIDLALKTPGFVQSYRLTRETIVDDWHIDGTGGESSGVMAQVTSLLMWKPPVTKYDGDNGLDSSPG